MCTITTTLETLNLDAMEIKSISRVDGTALRFPEIERNKSDALVKLINIEGVQFPGITLENERGETTEVIDMNNGIIYTLHYIEGYTGEDIGDPAEALPVGVS